MTDPHASVQVKTLVEGVPNLAMVETVDSQKLASKLDTAVAALGEHDLLQLSSRLRYRPALGVQP